MTVLFWDIDGTLLTTARAGVFAWEGAVRELTSREFELVSMRIAGLTDYQIAVKTFETLGVETDEAFVRRFVDRYGGAAAREPAAQAGKGDAQRPRDSRASQRLAGRPFVPADGEHSGRCAGRSSHTTT